MRYVAFNKAIYLQKRRVHDGMYHWERWNEHLGVDEEHTLSSGMTKKQSKVQFVVPRPWWKARGDDRCTELFWSWVLLDLGLSIVSADIIGQAWTR